MDKSEKNEVQESGESCAREHTASPRRWCARIGVSLIAIVAFLGVLPGEVCRDHAFICENTGSHKGYRQWCVGLRSGRWYRESRLEKFMRQQRPAELTNRWTSYQGTGKNLLGQSIRFGHARPQVGSVIMDQSWFNSHVDTLDDTAKLALYRVLASGSPEAIQAEEKKIEETVLGQARTLK